MSFNPFSSVGDYPGMLNKVATYTFFVALLLVWFVRSEIRDLDEPLSKLTLPIPIASGLNIPLGTVLPAFVIAFLSRVLKLHDRISDVLRIRQWTLGSENFFRDVIRSSQLGRCQFY